MLAIDISNYSGDLSAEQVQGLKDAGITRVIVQMVAPGILSHQQQIPVLKAAGIEVQGYVYLWMQDDVQERVRWASAECEAYGVPFLWLDCEDVTPGLTEDVAIAAINTAIFNSSVPTGIYTARWWWEQNTGNTAIFAERALWDANYDGSQQLGNPGYGGWTTQAMKQYHGDATVGGVPMVDLDYYEAAPVAVQEDDVVVNKADNQSEAATELVAAASQAAQTVAGNDGNGVFIYQSGSVKDEAGNTLDLTNKIATLLVRDA